MLWLLGRRAEGPSQRRPLTSLLAGTGKAQANEQRYSRLKEKYSELVQNHADLLRKVGPPLRQAQAHCSDQTVTWAMGLPQAQGAPSISRKPAGLPYLSFFFFLFKPAPAAYGSSQARGQTGAAATGLHHSSRQCRILNPLIEARGRTHNLTVPSWTHFHCTTTGTLGLPYLELHPRCQPRLCYPPVFANT